MSRAQPVILVVDDKRNMLQLMQKVLRADATVRTAVSGSEAVHILENDPINVVLCDLKMPGMDGLEVLRRCKRLRPEAEFVLMTAFASLDSAVEALRLGAYDYLTKPVEPETVRAVVLRALGRLAITGARQPDQDEPLPGVYARSRQLRELGELVKRFAASRVTVLLLGETGTGKERMARALHRLSPRAQHGFVAVNCAAIPADLLESELFGYSRGAFTGATQDRPGLFEQADGGTLFLDEIGEMKLSLQAKLTRALEERAIRRIGEAAERPVDARVVAATNRDLADMVKKGVFREDLWYRLNVATVPIPPLRDRKDDIELLALHFLREFVEASGIQRITGFTEDALALMHAYEWPGNVRQLRAAVERATVVAQGDRIEAGDLPPEILALVGETISNSELTWADALERSQAEAGRRYLEAVLRRCGGNVADAATRAGVERESFYRLMRRYRVEADRRRGGSG